jgi:hypothetical protein
MVYPVVFARHGIHRIEGIVDAVMFFIGLPHYQQAHLFIGVVDKGMAHARAGRKSHAVSGFKLPQITIDPGLRVTLQNVNKLLFVAFRMRIRSTASGRQPFMVNTNAAETQLAGQRRANRKPFIAVRIRCVIGAFHVPPVPNTVRSFHHAFSPFAMRQV